MATCKRCGRDNQDLYKFCLGCGAELGPTIEAGSVEVRIDETPAPKRVADIPTARDAAKTLDEDWDLRDRRDSLAHIKPIPAPGDDPGAGFETSGNTNIRPAPMRLCPTCGNVVPGEFAFCGQCGAHIDGPAVTAKASAPPRASTSAGTASGRLILIRPDGTEGGVHPLHEGENVIGRGMGSLFDADGYLSPRHAELVLNAAGAVVRDAGSLNGVYVKLTDEEELYDGDVFRIGQELLRFDVIPAPVPLDDGTDVMGSPNPGYWGRLALIVGRDQDGSAFPLFGDSITLGRERGDILFPEDGYVSGQHASVAMRDGRFWLADLGSSNGTFIRVRGERAVKNGAAILMGQQLFRISY
jgi:pSer/pThr/pTyr-binding forkhead associated (FHA) protein